MSIPFIDLRQKETRPTARDLLVSGVGKFGTGLGGVVKDFTQRRNTEKFLIEQGESPEVAKSVSGLPPELQKLFFDKRGQTTQGTGLGKFLDLEGQEEAEFEALTQEQQKLAIPVIQKRKEVEREQATIFEEKQQKFESIINDLDRADEIIESDLTGPFGSLKGSPANVREAKAELDSLRIGFLPLVESVLKGQISEGKLKILLDKMFPKAGLTRSTNRGRLKALRRIAEASRTGQKFTEKQIKQIIESDGKKSVRETAVKLQKVKQGTPLTDEIRLGLLEKFDRDPVKALEKAKQLGYNVGN